MLSQQLHYHSENFARWGAQGGVGMCPRTCATMARVLHDLHQQAQALEGQPIPEYIRAALPDGVVDMQAFRARRAAAGAQAGGAA